MSSTVAASTRKRKILLPSVAEKMSKYSRDRSLDFRLLNKRLELMNSVNVESQESLIYVPPVTDRKENSHFILSNKFIYHFNEGLHQAFFTSGNSFLIAPYVLNELQRYSSINMEYFCPLHRVTITSEGHLLQVFQIDVSPAKVEVLLNTHNFDRRKLYAQQIIEFYISLLKVQWVPLYIFDSHFILLNDKIKYLSVNLLHPFRGVDINASIRLSASPTKLHKAPMSLYKNFLTPLQRPKLLSHMSKGLQTYLPTRSNPLVLTHLDCMKNITFTIKSILESISGIFLILYSLQANITKSLASHKHLQCSPHCLVGSIENTKIHTFICTELQNKLLNKLNHPTATQPQQQEEEEVQRSADDEPEWKENGTTTNSNSQLRFLIEQLENITYLTDDDLETLKKLMFEYIEKQFHRLPITTSTAVSLLSAVIPSQTNNNSSNTTISSIIEEW